MERKIVPFNSASLVFKEWWDKEGQYLQYTITPKELASLAFDRGHETHHEEIDY